MNRFARTLAFATLAGALLCSAADAKTFRWARGQDAPTLDPHTENSNQIFGLIHQFYEPLAHRDQDGKIVPALATSWRILPDSPSVWEFKLRPGVALARLDATPSAHYGESPDAQQLAPNAAG